MNVISRIGNFLQIILVVEAHHAQDNHLVHNVQIGNWPLQFGEFFSGLGSCLQISLYVLEIYTFYTINFKHMKRF
jgi:hypothetical protein